MKHLAVIMDGNGRWGQLHASSRAYGYQYGAKAFVHLFEDFASLPIDVLTVYAFSSDNYKRSSDEVSNILSVIACFLYKEILPLSDKYKINVRFIGDFDGLDEELKKVCLAVQNRHLGAKKTVFIALNYSGTDEVVRAVNRAVSEGKKTLTKEDILSRLDTAGYPFPDAVLRYGGWQRLSDFLPLQSAYSELFFLDKFWPDYDVKDITDILLKFSSIQRNFGGNNG